MRIAVLSDPHGNLPALRAALDDAAGADVLVCAGDLVGYYPDVNEVCEAIRSRAKLCARGNHDAYVAGTLVPDPARREAYRTEWARQRLSNENLAWLSGLPIEERLEVPGLRLRVRHASPWDNETYVYPDSELLGRIELDPGEVLVLGHTHRPMSVARGGGRVVNPGSVGQPRDGDPRASWMLIDTDRGTFEVRRVAYAVAEYQARLSSLGWPPAVIALLSRER